MSVNLSKADVLGFEASGVILLKNVLTPEQVTVLKRGIDRGFQNPSPRHKVASEESDTGKFFEDFRCWEEIPEYREIIFNSCLPKLASKLMQSKTVRLHHDHMLIKAPKTQARTPWHQDTPYYNLEGNQTISFWIPVDPVPVESGLEFIAGSHKWPWMMPRTFKDNAAKWFPEGSLPELPDIEGNRMQFPIVAFDMQPGDVVAFNFHMMHAGQGSTGMRRAMSIRYIGDDVVHIKRPWVTSPYFPELEKEGELASGSPFNHRLFPVVYVDKAIKL
ncbi:phytanoyl-CoA dioxygenase [Angomonas deanei]|uniref:Phytanoyl-CoA dioxygenase (PhyH), putative n=1 Tax=Angomonas deanei TaxID=59799 RepID=A0A7G2CDX1_9TRYP|nr:phytanoyl-CoA dioxygenase [Angomonas deanei]CAD2218048.1 Phytanoyl-CoA dioxygenase (PhyH), putative [Angomonas deanei]|eukprot:EPY21019.1 phytanoyl-CoA dioxygenase [Angomonas deanei]